MSSSFIDCINGKDQGCANPLAIKAIKGSEHLKTRHKQSNMPNQLPGGNPITVNQFEKTMNLFTKIISGDELRKSRLHDEKGNFATWKNVFLHAGPAAVSGLLRISIGYRPVRPWIGYTSIKMLSLFLNRDSRVLEFGSGMSTIWYAQRAGEVFSVEDYRPWYDKVSKIIAAKKLNNITYKFTEDEGEYYSFMSDDTKGFDLVMIDGRHRSTCMYHGSKLIRPDGILYLDNSDKDSAADGGDTRVAEALARNFARNRGANITEITDFAPTQFFVEQGLCVRLNAG